MALFFNYSNDTVLLFSCPVYLTSRVRSKSVSGNFKQPQCGHQVLFRLIRLIRCWTTPETIWQTWVMRMGVSNFIVFFHFSSDLHSRFSFFQLVTIAHLWKFCVSRQALFFFKTCAMQTKNGSWILMLFRQFSRLKILWILSSQKRRECLFFFFTPKPWIYFDGFFCFFFCSHGVDTTQTLWQVDSDDPRWIEFNNSGCLIDGKSPAFFGFSSSAMAFAMQEFLRLADRHLVAVSVCVCVCVCVCFIVVFFFFCRLQEMGRVNITLFWTRCSATSKSIPFICVPQWFIPYWKGRTFFSGLVETM